MNEENDWDHNVEGEEEEGPVVCISREEVLVALKEITKQEQLFDFHKYHWRYQM